MKGTLLCLCCRCACAELRRKKGKQSCQNQTKTLLAFGSGGRILRDLRNGDRSRRGRGSFLRLPLALDLGLAADTSLWRGGRGRRRVFRGRGRGAPPQVRAPLLTRSQVLRPVRGLGLLRGHAHQAHGPGHALGKVRDRHTAARIRSFSLLPLLRCYALDALGNRLSGQDLQRPTTHSAVVTQVRKATRESSRKQSA